jgi:hypothetical protein
MDGKYYDVAFHVLNDRVLVKKEVYSEKGPFDAWQDACANVSEERLQIFVDNQYITLDCRYIVRVDVREVLNPTDKEMKLKTGVEKVMDTISGLGL